MNRNVERMQYPVDATGRDHEARINGATNNTAQWIPGPVVEPIQEIVKATLHHISGRSIIEPTFVLYINSIQK